MNEEILTKNFPVFNFTEGEVLIINKPYNWTSFDVVGKLRNSFKPLKLKVGHAGTLDPLATGLLILCTGKLTKQIETYQAEEKEYTGTFTLGATAPSYDLETEIDQTFDISAITENAILENCNHFIGDLEQYPPAHSAIKVGGERLYRKARRGEDVELPARKVTITEFEITAIRKLENTIETDFRVVCSKGTYIRSLARDFALQLKTVGHLTKLERTRIGDFKLSNAQSIEDFRKLFPIDRPTKNKS